jgi:hypothetical protein
MFHSADDIRDALMRLGRKLALRDFGEYSLLVCGGSALNLLSLACRSTRDVDALLIEQDGQPLDNADFPEELRAVAAEVAAELSLDVDWLNTAAAPLVAFGLPTGISKRAKKFEFGPCLTILAISRKDQIALKLYASLDAKKGKRHRDDLLHLNPTAAELKFAKHWLLDRPCSAAFRNAVTQSVLALKSSKLKRR